MTLSRIQKGGDQDPLNVNSSIINNIAVNSGILNNIIVNSGILNNITINNTAINNTTLNSGIANYLTLNNPVLSAGLEKSYITATSPTVATNITLSSGSIWYFTSTASNAGPWTFNLTTNGTLNTLMQVGQAATTSVLVTQGSSPTSYYANAITIDGVTQTTYWQNATTPVSGQAANALDIYLITAIKTGFSTFTVLASQTKF